MNQDSFSSIEDFVFNPTFRNWLLDNNSIYKEYWENWMKENPGKVPLLNYAKAIVYALTVNHKQFSEQEIEHEIKAIMQRTSSVKSVQTSKRFMPVKKVIPRLYQKMGVAAAVLGICLLSVIYFSLKPNKKISQADLDKFLAENSSTLMEQINSSDSIQVVTLFDGSTARLHPKSKLSFSSGTFGKKREVYLTGEALFDVRKDPSVPFVVYTKDLVTKVLGTTFNVEAYPEADRASVRVKTGKVSVYRKENFAEKNTVANKLDGLIVIPNQQVIYDVAKDQLRKTIIDEPVVLSPGLSQSFVFSSTPLKEVFRTLQNTYGINIIYDESVINSCSLSASMGNENFYEKLELICKAINAKYESIDGTIYISSQGCN